MFGPAFGPIIKQALTDSPEGQGLKKRLMVGTDWFMTEMQSCSPRDFWKLVHNTFEKYVSSKSVVGHHNKEILRELWTTLNALRFINLVGGKKSRLETLEKEVYASGVLPPWWKALKHHYEKGYHKDEHIKKFIKDISELEPSPEQKPDTTMTSDDYDDYVLEKGPFERPDSAAAGWPDVPP